MRSERGLRYGFGSTFSGRRDSVREDGRHCLDNDMIGPHRHCFHGFTLTEVMVAVFVLMTGLSGVLLAMSAMTRTARTTAALDGAMHEGRGELEKLRMLRYSAPELVPGTHPLSNGFYVVTAGPYGNTKGIAVTTTVHGPGGETSGVTIATLVTSSLHP